MKCVTGIKSVNAIPQPELSAVISAVMTTDGMRPDWIARLREERDTTTEMSTLWTTVQTG